MLNPARGPLRRCFPALVGLAFLALAVPVTAAQP
jgi:hypothetical protein